MKESLLAPLTGARRHVPACYKLVLQQLSCRAMLRQTSEGWGWWEWGLGWTLCAQWGDAVPTFQSPPWDPVFIYLEKGINTQANTRLQVLFLGWAHQPFPWLSSGLSWHVPLPCHDFQLLHSEVTSRKPLVLYPPVPFSFSLIALYHRQSFWHVHFISLWQEDGSMGKLWINSKSPKLEIRIALLSTVLLSWLPQWPEESKESNYELCFFCTSVSVNLVYASKWKGFPKNTSLFCKFSFSIVMSNFFLNCAWLLSSIISSSLVFHGAFIYRL